MDDQRPTAPAPPPRPARAHQLWLMVVQDDRVDTHPLPTSGAVVLGRGASADIRIERESVSREHAALTVGAELVLTDRRSRNGVYVGGARLAAGASATLRVGEVFHLGTTAAVVQRAVAAPGPTTTADAGAPIDDASLAEVDAVLSRVAAGDLCVLLQGETGAGKEVAADRLHRLSPRRDRPLVKLNCAAFTESLLESELFGHERGAFSGAVAAKPGLLESADGGTVFLDEVGELTPATQVKLLRVIEERAVRPVGAVRTRPIDVRCGAATNRLLEAEVAVGRFRADLYYRLAGAVVTIPPLRARPGAIEPLARGFVAAAAARLGRPPPRLSDEALARLRAHRWPGNVRELRNALERAVLMAPDDVIDGQHLPPGLGAVTAAPVAGAPRWWEPDAAAQERARIVAALEASGGHQGKAAELLGISRRTLLNRLDALGLPRPRKGG